MTILTMWDLSTGHLPKTDADKLENDIKDFPGQIINHNYGWMIPIIYNERTTLDDLQDCGMTKAFIKIYKYAQGKKYDWINFDQDAEEVNYLKKFTW